MFKALERGKRFVTHDVWHLGAPGEEVPHGLIIKQTRVVILLMQNLVRDALTLRAAALTFATALGIVPFLAILFYVIQTFNVDGEITDYLTESLQRWRMSTATDSAAEASGVGNVPSIEGNGTAKGPSHTHSAADMPELDLKEWMAEWLFRGVGQSDVSEDEKAFSNPVKTIMEYAEKEANPQTIGLTGLIFVLATVFGLMKNIESSFNTIWGIKRSRSWYRMFSDYLVLLLLLPFAVALVLSVTTVLETGFRDRLGSFAFALRGSQYLVIWFVFTAMYLLVPNTRVRFRYALASGVVAGTMWCLLSWAYVKFQVGVPKYTLFFSTFAQVPILLMWVYFSWLILLFGAELTFAYQYEKTFAMERLSEGASYAYKEALGLWTMVELGARFDAGKPPLSVVEFSERWNVPTRLVTDALDTLRDAGLVNPTDHEDTRYQPARSLEKITVGDIIGCLREAGRDPSPLRQEATFQPMLVHLFDQQADLAQETLAKLTQRLRNEAGKETPRAT